MPKPARLAVAVGVLVLLGLALSARAANGSCGNGVLDVGEECDDGNQADGDCCSATCTYEPSGALCTPDAVICTFDVCDGAGACTHPLRPQGSPCEANDDLCSKEQCDGAGSCVSAGPLVCDACSTCFAVGGCTGVPRTLGQGPGECHGPGGPSTLKVTNPADASRSRLDVKLTAFGPASFGDPVTATDYQLCVFQGGNSIAPVSAAAGGAWKPSKSGFTYRLDDAGGAARITLKPSGAVAKIQAKARGTATALDVPGSIGPAPFQVELRASTGECWGALFTPEESKIDGTKLRARTGP